MFRKAPDWRVVCPPLLAVLLAGCGRQPDPLFTVPEEMANLPAKHQENIRNGLSRLFGSPLHPRFLKIAATSEAEESAGDATTDGAADASVQSGAAADGLQPHMDADQLRYGAEVYQLRCAGCHGVSGDGQGPAAAYLLPKPRDYRRGIFKFTATPYGYKPARQDLVRVIRRGAKGTSMPAFPWMTDLDLQAVIDYVIYLSSRGEVERYVLSTAGEYEESEDIDFATEFGDALDVVLPAWEVAESQVVNALSPEPPYDAESVAVGRALFLKEGCAKCHGENGKGQTEWLSPQFIAAQKSASDAERVQINYDEWGQPAPAADITARLLHGGRRPIDIYRRICTGINGTPMPAFQQQFAADPDRIWHLVHYVQHIIEGGDPLVAPAELPPTAAEAAAAEATAAETAASETVASETTAAEATSTEPATSEPVAAEAPAEETPVPEPPATEAPAAEPSTPEAPTSEAPTSDPPATESPAAGAPTAESPGGEPPLAEGGPASTTPEPASP